MCVCVSILYSGQFQLLDVCSSLFLATSLSTMTLCAQSGLATPTGGQGWVALGDEGLSSCAAALLVHVARLLAIFSCIIDCREPEARETRVGVACMRQGRPGWVWLTFDKPERMCT